MLAKKTARAQQRDVTLVGHSPAVLEVFELLNVAAYFGDHLVMDSRARAGASRS
jgi:anti-anti-sigma regulatory factor